MTMYNCCLGGQQHVILPSLGSRYYKVVE